MWDGYSVIGLLIVGIVLGVLGRFFAPGEQKIPFWLTIIAGIVGALIGNLVSGWFGVRDTPGVDWWRHVFQVIAAVLAVMLAAAIYPRSRSRA